MVRNLTLSQVALHNQESDCYVIVDDLVLDVTQFLKTHPGGRESLMNFAGQDASRVFRMSHTPDIIPKHGWGMVVGKVI